MGDLRKNRNKQQKEGNINIEFEHLLNRKNEVDFVEKLK